MKTAIAPKPFLKWAGGKQGLARQLVDCFPQGFQRYYEPFLGGGSVLFALQPDTAIAGDFNPWLLDTYRAIQFHHEEVATLLDTLANTRNEFERIRAVRPEDLHLTQRAAHFIYLNKTCFRGLFRVNRKGHFNVPYGAYARRYYDLENLEAAAACLQGVELRPGDFEACVADIRQDDFVYFDPPYYKQGGYADFDRYTRLKFREDDHIRLAALCRSLTERQIRWALSNSDTPFVRNLFQDCRLMPIANRREINLNSRNRTISELLITNFP